jgi:tetratricopeptide (TPR) repeat protein
MTSFSVIVTAHNCAAVLRRTLQSVHHALVYYRSEPNGPKGAGEVIIVEDGSTDATASVAADFLHGKDGWNLLRRPQASSPCCARNTGDRKARGDLLFFLDGDDLFLPEHIAACCRALEDPALDFIKTGVRLADPVHPDWKKRIDFSVIINLCLRRRCHDELGGFPDYHLFRRVGDRFTHEKDLFFKIEDMYYNRLVDHFFRGRTLARETVDHLRSPGNSFDRQYAKFCQPFNGQTASGEEAQRLRFAELLFAEQIARHHQRSAAPNRKKPPPAPEEIVTADQPDPADPEFHLGTLLADQGQRAEAVAHYRRALQAQPDHADALLRLGVALAEQGQLDEAVSHLRAAVQARPESAAAHYNLGVALAEQNHLDEAARCLQEALRLRPDYAAAFYSLANVVQGQGKRDEVVAQYRAALRCKPDYFEAYNNLGLALFEFRRRQEAVVILEQAARLRPQSPEAHNNLGMALVELGWFAEAEACYREALRLNPQYADAHNNLDSAFKEQGRLDEALASYQVALWHGPDSAGTHWNRSLAWLCQGNYAQGVPEYEWRWRRKMSPPRRFTQPPWDGSDLAGRTLLIWMEQGLGDMIRNRPRGRPCRLQTRQRSSSTWTWSSR